MCYDRQCVWQDSLNLAWQTEVDWVNEFAMAGLAEDIRFMLKGYGWRQGNPGDDDDMPVMQFGSYKCYYRKQGDTTWKLFANVKSGRRNDSEEGYYADVLVDTGTLPRDYYEIRIEAKDGPKHEAWGDWIEGIVKNQQFWFDLEYRCFRPLKISVYDEAYMTDWSFGGKEIIELSIAEAVSFQDALSRATTNYEIVAVDIDIILLQEVVELVSIIFRQIFEVIYVVENVAFFSQLIQLWSSQENIAIAEYTVYEWSLWNMETAYDAVSVIENLNIGRSIIDMSSYQEVSVVEWFDKLKENELQPSVFQNIMMFSEIAVLVRVNYLQPQLFDDILVQEWLYMFKSEGDLPVQYEIIPVGDFIEILVSPLVVKYQNISVVEYLDLIVLYVLAPQVYQEISIEEYAVLAMYELTEYVDVGEDISIVEDVVVQLPIEVSVIDNVAVEDYGTIYEVIGYIVVDETISAVEDVAFNIEMVHWKITKFDDISVNEDVNIARDILYMTASDDISVNEYTEFMFDIYVFDDVMVMEAFYTSIDSLFIVEVETLSVIESSYNPDPIRLRDSQIIFHAHFDGDDDSQLFPEESKWQQVYTVVNGTPDSVKLDTAQKKFGSASLLCPTLASTDTYIRYKTHQDFNIGNNDFSIEVWWRKSAWPADSEDLGILETVGGTSGFRVYATRIGTGARLFIFEFSEPSLAWDTRIQVSSDELPSSAYTLDTWHCWVIERRSHNWRMWFDGYYSRWIQVAGIYTEYHSGWVYYQLNLGSGWDLAVGGGPHPYTKNWGGWLDEIIIVNGQNLYGELGVNVDYPLRTEAYGDVAIIRPTLIDIDVIEFFDAVVLGERQIFGIERVSVEMNLVAYTDPMAIFIRTNLTDIVHIADWLLSSNWIAISRAVSVTQTVTVTESRTMVVV